MVKKCKSPKFPELLLANTKDHTANPACKFTGTANPRHLRVIRALIIRPRSREEIDRIAGCANGPDLIRALRRRGLRAKCTRTQGIDRDGRAIKYGVYHLDDHDRSVFNAWLSLRDAGGTV